MKILLRKPVNVSLSLKFLAQFTRATSLSPTVTLGMSSGVPMLVEYPFEDYGYLRFYLAPKVEDDNNEDDDMMGSGNTRSKATDVVFKEEDDDNEDY